MPSITQVITIRDSTVTSGENRKTGLTLAWVHLKKLSDNSNATQPSFTEIGNGQYKFSYDADANGEAAGQIDAGATLDSYSDRYIDVLLAIDSGRIQLALPNVAAGGSSGLLINGSNTGTVALAGLTSGGTAVSTYAGGDTSGTTTLLSRLSATRAGYLDNLNVGGAVASAANLLNISNNTRVRATIPTFIERPDSGSESLTMTIELYDAEGNMEAPDSTPTVALVDRTGTDLSSRLSVLSNPSTGRYTFTYNSDESDALTWLRWTVSVVEGSVTRTYSYGTTIVDTTAVDFTASDRSQLLAISAGVNVVAWKGETPNDLVAGKVQSDATVVLDPEDVQDIIDGINAGLEIPAPRNITDTDRQIYDVPG